jgi:tRNA(fMet)-specific endonuclease VapC
MILLDTDTFTLHQYGNEKVQKKIQMASEVPAITVVTQIEALRGRYEALIKAADGAGVLRGQQGLLRTLRHLALFQVVLFDDAVATEFDHLREIKGLKKIGRTDMLIASIAMANKSTLVTRNTKDFQKVPGLHIENWAD